MAKNTLTFSAVKQSGTIAGSSPMGVYATEGEQTLSVVDERFELNGEDYLYDSVTGDITLNAGESIRVTDATQSGGNLLLLIYGKNEVIELTKTGRNNDVYTAEEQVTFKLGALAHYTSNSHYYQITTLSSYYTDSSKAVSLKKGDKLSIKTHDKMVYILGADGEKIASLYKYKLVLTTETHQGDSITADEYMPAIYLATKSSGDGVEYEILPEESSRRYEAEYSGKSGILHVRKSKGGKVHVLADAGAGYIELCQMEGRNMMRALNMAGLTKVKFVSEVAIDECIVNEF